MLTTGRGAVSNWECDQWGHLNVQFYLAKASDAHTVLAAQLGLAPSRLRAQANTHALLGLKQRVLFKRELRAGDVFTMTSGVRAVDAAGTLDIATRMVNLETQAISALFETRLCWADLESAAPCPWPADWLAALQPHVSALPDFPPPAPMAYATPEATQLDSLLLSYRGTVTNWDCDANGIAPPRAHIARFAECIVHVFAELQLTKSGMLGQQLGSAALDYDIVYHQPLRVGQAIEVRSGVLGVGPKVFHVFHHLVNSATKAPITSIVIAIVFFDLQLRKSVPLPTHVREHALRLVAQRSAQ